MALNVQSLNVVNQPAGIYVQPQGTPIAGIALMFDEPLRNISYLTDITGSATSVDVALEVTLDGSTWAPAEQFSPAIGGPFFQSISPISPVLGARLSIYNIQGGSASVSGWLAASKV